MPKTNKSTIMKKIIFCLLMAIVLTNCEVKVKETKAQDKYLITKVGGLEEVVYTYKDFNNMKYVIISGISRGNSRPPTVSVINLTKDELEVQLLRKQLNSK